MKEEYIKSLKEKYKAGLTSFEEEGVLFNKSCQHDEEIKSISYFISEDKIETPTNFNEKLWPSFESKISTKKSITLWVWSAVASITLILSLYLGYIYNNKLSELKKHALLEDAKGMFLKKNDKVLFEDEFLIVYKSNQ